MSAAPYGPDRPPHDEPLDRSRERPRRQLVLGARDMRLVDRTVVCRVQLFRRRDAFWGEAHDIDTELGRARAAARATLDAAGPAADGLGLALEGVTLPTLFGRRYAVVSVEAAFDREFGRLTGIAAVDASVEDAACVATLDAIERWVAR